MADEYDLKEQVGKGSNGMEGGGRGGEAVEEGGREGLLTSLLLSSWLSLSWARAPSPPSTGQCAR